MHATTIASMQGTDAVPGANLQLTQEQAAQLVRHCKMLKVRHESYREEMHATPIASMQGTGAVRIPGANLQLTQAQAAQLVRHCKMLKVRQDAESYREVALKLFKYGRS